MRRIWQKQAIGLAMVLLLVGGFILANRPTVAPASTSVVPLAGDLLRGRTIIIDPGHGGYDPGALGQRSREADINLAIAYQLRHWFQEAGAHVLLTWGGSRKIPDSQKYRVSDRMTWINKTQADVLIDIHCNSGGRSWRGPQTFYWSGAASYHLAHDVQEELGYFTNSHRTVTRINQFVLRHAHMPAINVEVGFITNPVEEMQLVNPVYQKNLSWYIFLGTERWFLKGRWPQQLLQTPPPTHMLVR